MREDLWSVVFNTILSGLVGILFLNSSIESAFSRNWIAFCITTFFTIIFIGMAILGDIVLIIDLKKKKCRRASL